MMETPQYKHNARQRYTYGEKENELLQEKVNQYEKEKLGEKPAKTEKEKELLQRKVDQLESRLRDLHLERDKQREEVGELRGEKRFCSNVTRRKRTNRQSDEKTEENAKKPSRLRLQRERA